MENPLDNTRLAFIGAGAMGEALISGLLAAGRVNPDQVVATDARPQRVDELRTRFAIRTGADNRAAAATADVLVLAVKPQVLPVVLAELRGVVRPEALVLSIVAGASSESLAAALDHRAIVRTMPNTPAQVGAGMTVWTATPDVADAQREQARAIVGAFGHELYVADERFLDRATAVSGSGPAYVFLFHRGVHRRGGALGVVAAAGARARPADGARLRAVRRAFRRPPGGAAQPGHVAGRHDRRWRVSAREGSATHGRLEGCAGGLRAQHRTRPPGSRLAARPTGREAVPSRGASRHDDMQKLLIANRGEIAIRIMRAATELGLRTATIYSREDRLGLHRFKADEAYGIGGDSGPVAAYLDIGRIIDRALQCGADAIHPGYGFLSENRELAQACAEAGITFVGPTPELLERLGDKTEARRIAAQADVPIVPGAALPAADPGAAQAAAEAIGYPLIVKASFGGGGRGMRVVHDPGELAERIDEARNEALRTFGDGSVFLERYIARARHIEVQILADEHGNAVHLWERDCSVQRRHQKVIEVAPAAQLDDGLRDAICAAAIRVARETGYRNAGTVEFLVDADTQQWYFIEVNPRIQVEHTVTEVITGIDIVRAQILIAQGCKLHDAPLQIPPQEQIPRNGFAIQCRITTEDPADNFAPDYGRLQTYRSPAGLGIRLDGAAYAGAVLSPFYDSLLVKLTSWDSTLRGAAARTDRALREFRIRGVKTNIQFLQNVVSHARFLAGDATTGFLDETPELFAFRPARDRANRLLAYIGDTIVNGNSTLPAGRRPARCDAPPAVPVEAGRPPAPGTRQRLLELGPEGFCDWVRQQQRLLITDTTFRDAHQSLLATRVRTHDLLATAPAVARRLPELFSLEMWGGATFDAALRFLHEDPWERLRSLREAVPNICFQMLLRASNAVGYTSYPDNVVREFTIEAAAAGHRHLPHLDSLTDVRNMRVAMDAVRDTAAICEPANCYTGDLHDPRRPKYNLNYYLDLARQLERMGAHILCIKDMAGLCRPYAAHELVRVLRAEIGLPVHFHTHDASGLNAATLLKASEADVDIVDAAVAALSGSTANPI